MKVVSLVRESVASPRTGYDKSASLRLDLEGETHLPLQTPHTQIQPADFQSKELS